MVKAQAREKEKRELHSVEQTRRYSAGEPLDGSRLTVNLACGLTAIADDDNGSGIEERFRDERMITENRGKRGKTWKGPWNK